MFKRNKAQYISIDRVDLRANDKLDEFIIDKKLGEGAFGIVFKAKSNTDNKTYALKILKLWEAEPEDRSGLKDRFNREYECGNDLTDENLCRTLKKGEYKGNPYFTMEYCSGGCLREKMIEHKTLSSATNISHQILKGLQALHKKGIVHRDIKPENILFDHNGKLKITDYGIAAYLKARETRIVRGKALQIFGTALYMPPEQEDAKGAAVFLGPRSDIFAFGVMMYEILTDGHYPFGDPDDDVAKFFSNKKNGVITDLKKYRTDLPPSWTEILKGCLHHDNSQRYENVSQILHLLGEPESVEYCPFCKTPLKNQRYYTCPSCGKMKGEHLYLVVLNGTENGKEYYLNPLMTKKNSVDFSTLAGIISLGREDEEALNNINISEHGEICFISRNHATIEKHRNNDVWYIRDGQFDAKSRCWKRSTNGTLVNSTKVTDLGEIFYPNDIITLGDTTLKVELRNSHS